MSNLFAYGHSYVEGAGAGVPSRRFAALVAGDLSCELRNLAVGSSLSAETAIEVCQNRHVAASYLLLMTGLNDARLYGERSEGLAGYESALESVLGNFAVMCADALVIAVEQPHLLDYTQHAPFDKGSDAAIDSYNDTLTRVAGRFDNVRIARPLEWDASTMLTDDTVHPNDSGHRELAAAVRRVLPGPGIQPGSHA